MGVRLCVLLILIVNNHNFYGRAAVMPRILTTPAHVYVSEPDIAKRRV
jgi:hypothetical protein